MLSRFYGGKLSSSKCQNKEEIKLPGIREIVKFAAMKRKPPTDVISGRRQRRFLYDDGSTEGGRLNGDLGDLGLSLKDRTICFLLLFYDRTVLVR